MQLTLNEAQNQLPLILLPTTSNKPQFGCAKGLVKMLDNFDDPSDEFVEMFSIFVSS